MIKPITGTFFEFMHHNQDEGKYYNDVITNFTEEQWRAKVREIRDSGMDMLVLMASALFSRAYYKSSIFSRARVIKCPDPMEVMLSEADKLGMSVFLSCGFYGNWRLPMRNMTDPKLVARGLTAMNEMMEQFGHHPSVVGFYMPDEVQVSPRFNEDFITYVNTVAAETHKLGKDLKTLIAPYGTRLVVPDDNYIEQLERMDVDYIAYQDEIGVQKTRVGESAAFYEGLCKAHQKAGRARLWADVETFAFEGKVYHSALLPTTFDRLLPQLEAVSPYVDKVIIYEYLGMMSKKGSVAPTGGEAAEKLHTDYCNYFHI